MQVCIDTGPPVYTDAASLPTDGSVLLALIENEFGNQARYQGPHHGGRRMKRILVKFAEPIGTSPVDVELYSLRVWNSTGSTSSDFTDTTLPTGWIFA